MDLSLSQNFFDLGTYFSKRRVLRASKRDLEREISTTVDRDWIFFLPRFRSTKQAAEAFFLAYRLIKSGRELSIHSIITVIHFSRAIKLYKRFYEIISRNYEFRKFWSVDYSFRYFLSHSISSANQVVMQIGELTIRGYFGPCSHVTETQGFFKQKNWKASENVQKSEITRW